MRQRHAPGRRIDRRLRGKCRERDCEVDPEMNATFSILCRVPGVSGRAHLRVNLNFQFVIVLSLLCLCPALRLYGQSPSLPLPSSDVGPETGFLSPSQYTNAFFGFSMSLPQDAGLREQTLSLNRGTRDHLLIGFHSPSKIPQCWLV